MDDAAPQRETGAPTTRRGSWFATGRAGWALALLWAACVLPGFFALPPVDRDESRFAQASRQMWEGVAEGDAGALVVPRIQDRPRLNKPPLIYWLQSIPGAAFDRGPWGVTLGPLESGTIWAYRIPSALCALAAVLMTWRLGRRMFHPAAAWWGAALLGACVMLMWDARQARADQLLLACTVAAQWGLWEVWRRASRGRPVGAWRVLWFWCAIALGVLAKGPITPMVALLTALAMSAASRRWRWMLGARPLVGLGIVAAVVAPWVVGVAAEVGFRDYLSLVYDETIGRSGAPKESHWGPPGYHLVLSAVIFFPGSLVTLAAVAWAFRRSFRPARPGVAARLGALRNRRGADATLFCLAWLVPSWLVFEASATKLPHYTLPLYPALALLTARGLLAIGSGRLAWGRDAGSRVGVALWTLIGTALCVVFPVFLLWTGVGWGPLWVAALAGVALAVTLLGEAAYHAWRGDALRAQWPGLGAAVVGMTVSAGMLLPRHSELWVSSRLAAVIRAADAADVADPAYASDVALVGYAEDSLLFLTRGRAERTGRGRIGELVNRSGLGLTVVEPTAEPPAVPGWRRIHGVVGGFNYSNGERVSLRVVGFGDWTGEPGSYHSD